MKKSFIIVFASLSLCMLSCKTMGSENGSGLPTFGADLGKKSVARKEIRVPYTSLTSYYGYIAPDSQADEEIKGKKIYYLYIWIPVAAPEIGIRMASPATGTPADGDFITDAWNEGAVDTEKFFDTWIKLDRAIDIINPADIPVKINTTKWVTYETNDDSSEMPANPAGKKYNSLLRITNDLSNPTKTLIRGLYRIGFTTYKTGEVQGSFIAQVGAPINLPGIVIVKDKSKILETIQAAENK